MGSPARSILNTSVNMGFALQGTLGYSGFGDVDLVVEAAVENVKLKQQIFAGGVGMGSGLTMRADRCLC